MILRTVNWDRRNPLCREFGVRAGIVYSHHWGVVACDNRLRVKEFLSAKYGRPVTKNMRQNWINVDGEWLAVKLNDNEYVVAVRDRKLRDWLLLL